MRHERIVSWGSGILRVSRQFVKKCLDLGGHSKELRPKAVKVDEGQTD